jgi:hypothetical protein
MLKKLSELKAFRTSSKFECESTRPESGQITRLNSSDSVTKPKLPCSYNNLPEAHVEILVEIDVSESDEEKTELD